MIPSLTILVPPILAVIGLRLVLYVGLHNITRIIISYVQDASKGKPKFLDYVSTVEGIIGVGIIWAGINMFFTDQIDYNTKYAIGGTLAAGFALIAFYFIDKIKSKVIIHPSKRDIYVRVLTLVTIAIIAGSIMAVKNRIPWSLQSSANRGKPLLGTIGSNHSSTSPSKAKYCISKQHFRLCCTK
jgi:hypothetical protein